MSDDLDLDQEEEGGGVAPWMATFADLSTLLLTFFVLLFTFAEIDAKKFEMAMGSIQNALAMSPSGDGVLDQSSSLIAQQPSPEATYEEVATMVEEMVQNEGLEESVNVEVTPRGVVVQIEGQFFFSAGTADLREQAHSVLERIGDLMESYPYEMAIEGHTDDVPVSGGRFSSNWELSTSRAYSALRHLEETKDLDLSRVHISGFADTRPLASNDTPEGRAKNRRVEFVFFRDKDEEEAAAPEATP